MDLDTFSAHLPSSAAAALRPVRDHHSNRDALAAQPGGGWQSGAMAVDENISWWWFGTVEHDNKI